LPSIIIFLSQKQESETGTGLLCAHNGEPERISNNKTRQARNRYVLKIRAAKVIYLYFRSLITTGFIETQASAPTTQPCYAKTILDKEGQVHRELPAFPLLFRLFSRRDPPFIQ
jgi:hypothetical protein